jgi:VHL beta domain
MPSNRFRPLGWCGFPLRITRMSRIVFVGLTTLVLGITIPVHQGLGQSSGERARILPPQSCRIEPRLRSLNSQVSTNVRFVNRSNLPVKVYWVDFDGKRQHYFDLAPEEARWQQTYVTHPWVITESGPNQPCLSIFMPQTRSGVAILE